MMRLKITFTWLFMLSSILIFAQGHTITVPIAGNYFAKDKNHPKKDFKVYIRFAKTGKISIALASSKGVDEKVKINVGINNQIKQLTFNKGEKLSSSFDEWNIVDTGYFAIEINNSSSIYTNLENLIISGSAIDEKTAYVKNNDGNFFYWGRRGPSVHLNYQMPEQSDAEWFYNELTVPKGEDVIGSYFMANGFGEGYFGIQVNSASERRVLFSVWSPFTTDDPKSIPESHKIKLLKKGDQVHVGEFGNEGSGGQSYLKYDWKAGNTYRFLLHATTLTAIPKPNISDGTVDTAYVTDSTTNYTAYFFAPELNKWQLIASFKRPKTQTYLKRLHSFLENFIPEMGDKERKVLFNNQWIYDTKGNWIELNTARFTTDNTGAKKYRMDFAGGLDGSSFYLQNCGFFSKYTVPKIVFTRPLSNEKPTVDFRNLP